MEFRHIDIARQNLSSFCHSSTTPFKYSYISSSSSISTIYSLHRQATKPEPGGCIQMDSVAKLASQKAVVIFSKSSCCMCYAIKRLFYEQGASPMVLEVDEYANGQEVEQALVRLQGCSPGVPAVFVGGKLVGSAKNILTLHVDGSLKKMLKDAGAIWL